MGRVRDLVAPAVGMSGRTYEKAKAVVEAVDDDTLPEPVRAEAREAVAEIAERLGATSTTTVHQWRRRHPDFPQPVVRPRQAMVWAWPEVERWARATGRL